MILKRKNRYILVESTRRVDAHLYGGDIRSRMLEFMGVPSYVDASPRIIPVSDNVFIVRVSRNTERQAIAALSFIKSIGNTKLGLCTIKTSGTIKSLLNAVGSSEQR